ITNVDFYVDSVFYTNDTTSPYSVGVPAAAAGAHTVQAVGWDSNGNAVTSAVVNVTAANLAPNVSITSPANNNLILVGSNVTVTASATDDAAVTNVDFYVDGVWIGSTNTSPYTTAWLTTTAGAHALTAVATDSDGLSTTSSVVTVTNTLPVVSITT